MAFAGSDMLAFDTRHGARFSCSADLSRGPVVNVHFFDAERETIPFHLSLRRDEKLIVVNRRDMQGWRREIRFPFDPRHRAIRFEVIFSARHAVLAVDGQSLGRFDALPRIDRGGRYFLRRGFSGLSGIAHVEIDGPVVPGSLQMQCAPTAEQSGIHLNDAHELVLRWQPGLPDQGVALRAGDKGDPIPAVLRRLPYTDDTGVAVREWAAIVPGRVWDGAGDALTLSLCDETGTPLASLDVSRALMAKRIGELAQSQALMNDDRAALQAIEHARHARLLPLMTAPQFRMLLAAAGRFRLGPYLTEGQSAPEPTTPRTAPVNSAAQRQSRLRDGFTRHMRGHPQDDPLSVLRSAMASDATPKPLRATLITALTEWFCLNAEPRALAQFWRDEGLVLQGVALTGDRWTLSAQLPLLYCEGRFHEVAQALWALAPSRNDWILTPCVGWIARQIAVSAPSLDQRLPSAAQRRAMMDALAGFLDSRASDYWERTECSALIAGLVALLAESSTLPRDQHDALIWQVLRVYGLSPGFWDRVETSRAQFHWTLPLRLQRAQAAFTALRELITRDPVDRSAQADQIDRQLDLFRQWGCVDAARFRRDLLGPAGVHVASDQVLDPNDSLLAGLNPEEAALRYLAYPRDTGFDAPLPAALTEAARRGLVGAYAEVPVGAYQSLQAEALADARALIEGADQPTLQRLLRHLTPMAGPEGAFLGIGLAISLVGALLTQGRTAEATVLTGQIAAMRNTITDHWAKEAFFRAPSPMLALRRLKARHPQAPQTQRITAALGAGAESDDPGTDTCVDLQTHPLLNTVVCLYSCQGHLGTRVQAIREGWMAQLRAMGVPCLVFVGGGEGTRTGDVVALACPDDYEGLPQKTLAMVQWLRDHSNFDYMFKVDDDCFLDPQAFFTDLSWQKFDYYGRPLTRGRGQMDRTWHMRKSASPRGRLELDKSPEPSTYADGGSGYSLSRQAMEALCTAADTADGKDLIHQSFMEDKLVGDLLAQQGIWPSGEDYRISVLRRTMPGGPLVPAWENGFLPFAGSGIKLAHLDGHKRQDEVLKGSHDPWPRTFKVWPSPQPVRLGWRSNTLDLISTPIKLAQVNEAAVAVIACLRNERFMLPHFLDHYRALGVRGFLIADNGSDDGSFEYLADQPDVALFAVDTDYSASHYGVAWQQALMGNFRSGRWSLVADADELAVWTREKTGDLTALTADMDADGATAVRLFMLDMYPHGPLAGADFDGVSPFDQARFVDADPFLAVSGARGPYSNSPTWTSALRHRLIPESRAELFVAQKYALLKYQPWMRLSAGLHFVANAQVAQQELFFAHFKYNAAFHAKAQAEVARQQHFNNAEEYSKYLSLASEGRDVIFDPEISVPWHDSAFVRRRLR